MHCSRMTHLSINIMPANQYIAANKLQIIGRHTSIPEAPLSAFPKNAVAITHLGARQLADKLPQLADKTVG